MKIITIAGSGRSGSTLLALLLSQAEQAFNLGQMRHLASAWLANAPCSCGKSLQDCAIYASIIPEVFGLKPEVGLAAFQKGLGAMLKDIGKSTNWGEADTRKGLTDAHATTLEIIQRLIKTIGTHTGATTFVDSSKMPEMALAFDLAFPGDVVVVNLLRDPRAVACSWHLKRASYISTFRNMRVWSSRQKQLDAWRAALGNRFVAVKYEEFAARPGPVLHPAFAAAGLHMPPGLFPEPQRAWASWDRQHIFPPANESVLRDRLSDIPIRRSDGWKNPKNGFLHALALAATWPLGRKHYPAREDVAKT
jgi:Sulfotransferase family